MSLDLHEQNLVGGQRKHNTEKNELKQPTKYSTSE